MYHAFHWRASDLWWRVQKTSAEEVPAADDHHLADMFASPAAIRVSDAMETGTVQVSMAMYSSDARLELRNAQLYTCVGLRTVPWEHVLLPFLKL